MLFSSPQPPASPTLFPYTTLFRSVGAATADELLGRTPGTDWDTWTPGHPAAAAEVVGASGVGDELRDALADVGVTVKSVPVHRFDDRAQMLADGIAAGDHADTIATKRRGVPAKPVWARLAAETEPARAVSKAARERYSAAGIDSVEWAIAPDQRVCPMCEGNAAQGPVPTGARFAAGDRHPPGHPRCRCALLPVLGD